ncbi:MAG TPA: serine/threonine-protein kinase [Kofleriaceae bacterium]|nr:serine/threonine-protein kinase [Kofleriaceae bacterium]
MTQSSDDDEPSPSQEMGSMGPLLAAVARTGPSALPAGTVVGGQYRIERSIGEGGMGVVYLARDTRLDRDVAVKLGSAVSQAALRRIEREAMALAKLSHPNVVVVYQVGEIDGRVFIAMEHVDGGTARSWLNAAPRSTAEIVSLYAAAGDGLAAAHAAGLIHRDFKPDNVLVGVNGRPRVADFGLARLADPEVPSPSAPAADITVSTQTGVIVGTPAYMPPEQLAGGELDARADQFAFAAALWEALFGARPFDGKTPADVLAAIESQPPAASADATRGRRVPRHVLAALRRALSPERTERWPDMAALVAELRRDPAAKRRRAGMAGIAVAGGAIVAALAVLVLTRDGDAPSPCKAAGDTTRSTWTPANKDAVRAALAATGAPGAADAADRISATLDRQVGAIGAARIAACEATHVRRTQSAELLDRRNQCLDRRESAVAALIDVALHVEAGKPTSADAILPAAAVLEDPAECADSAHVAALPSAAADPATRAARAEVQAMIELSAARHRAGLEDDALAVARNAVAKADVIEDAALGAEARLRVGETQAIKDAPGAMTILDHAARQAAEAKDDVLAARISLEMMGIATNPMKQLDEAERLRPLADSAVIRAGDPPRLRASYLARLARLRNEQGEIAAARDAIERALALQLEDFGPDDARLAQTLNYLALIMSDQGQHDAAIGVRQRAEKLLVAAYGPEHPHIGVVVTNLGISYFELGRLPEALAAFERALGIKERTLGADHPSILPNLVNIANVLIQLGRIDDAVAHLERARTLAAKVYGEDHPGYARVLSVLSDALVAKGDIASAETILVDVLAVQTEAGPDRPEIAHTLFGLGDIRRKRGDLKAARTDLERARAIIERTTGEGSPEMAESLGYLAELEAAEGNPAQARRTMQRAIGILERALGPDHPDVKSMRAELAALPAAR